MHLGHQGVPPGNAARALGQARPAAREAGGTPKDGGGPPGPPTGAARAIEGHGKARGGQLQPEPRGGAEESKASACGDREPSPELPDQPPAGGTGSRGPFAVAPAVVNRGWGPPPAAGPRPAEGPMVPEHRPKEAPGPCCGSSSRNPTFGAQEAGGGNNRGSQGGGNAVRAVGRCEVPQQRQAPRQKPLSVAQMGRAIACWAPTCA